MAWRILLNYLPEKREAWVDYVHKQRTLYDQFIGTMQYIVSQFNDWPLLSLLSFRGGAFTYLDKNHHFLFIEEIIIQPEAKAAHEDHPLNSNPNSTWQSFFKDNEVLLQVIYQFVAALIRP